MGEILPNFVCWLFDCQSALHKRKSKSDPIGNSWPQSGLKRHQISESFIIAELTHPPEIKCNTLAALFNSSFGLVDSLSYAGVKKSDPDPDIIMRVERNLHWNKDMSHLYRNIKM